MKKSTKNLYLPGTNKNVGYLDNDTLHIYKKYIKYFTLPSAIIKDVGKFYAAYPVIFLQKEKAGERHVKLDCWYGYLYNIEEKAWNFFCCEFSTPDNLDVIEM